MPTSTWKDEALTAALAHHWEEAIALNQKILEEEENDIDTLNRLAYALAQHGKIDDAQKTYKSVLKLDPYNTIAAKNLARLKSLDQKKSDGVPLHCVTPDQFLEEPGKTKIVDCVNVAPSAVIANLSYGQEMVMKTKKHGVDVRTSDGDYIGALPDDVAFRLNKLITAGNTYCVHIKGITKNCVSIFIRELSRASALRNQPSFIGKTSYIPYSREEGSEKPDTGENGDEENADQAE